MWVAVGGCCALGGQLLRSGTPQTSIVVKPLLQTGRLIYMRAETSKKAKPFLSPVKLGQRKTPSSHTISSRKKIKNVSERHPAQITPSGLTPETLQISMYKTGFIGSAPSNRKCASQCKPSATIFDFQTDRMGAAFFVQRQMAFHLGLQLF